MRIQYLNAFLLGAITAILGVIAFSQARGAGIDGRVAEAQSVDSSGGYTVGTVPLDPAARNFLWVLNATDKGAPRLCVYEAKETGLTLKYARNVTYDFMYDQFPSRADAQVPSVQDVFNETKKKREEERKAAEKKPG